MYGESNPRSHGGVIAAHRDAAEKANFPHGVSPRLNADFNALEAAAAEGLEDVQAFLEDTSNCQRARDAAQVLVTQWPYLSY